MENTHILSNLIKRRSKSMKVVEKALFLSGIALFVVFVATIVTFLKQMGVS